MDNNILLQDQDIQVKMDFKLQVQDLKLLKLLKDY